MGSGLKSVTQIPWTVFMDQLRPFIGGNWKMNLHLDQARDLARALIENLQQLHHADVVICPAFPYLAQVGVIIAESTIRLGAQDFYHQSNGAFTGEVSLSMLADVGADVVLVGHSERRHVLGESDATVNEKVLAALDADFDVILCVGETGEQRAQNHTEKIICGQLLRGLANVSPEQLSHVTIAYEPVWAIGTGNTATPNDAQNAHQLLRHTLKDQIAQGNAAPAVRIQYGGSVKPDNAVELIACEDVDGFLVGGASLNVDDFSQIVKATVS
tara:strand:+ start:5564 stop:6379 length:816 start_codon:yes stop_codon:yes gene_type:complete